MTGSGVLAMVGRGSLPFTELHDRPLFLHALHALVEVVTDDVTVVVDPGAQHEVARRVARTGLAARVLSESEWWAGVCATPPGAVLLHDPLCPLASSRFLAGVRDAATQEPGTSAAAYRPVTDTVKTVADDQIHGTIDREGLAAVVAPVALSAPVVSRLVELRRDESGPPLHDFAWLVEWLRARAPVTLVRAPSLARRVEDTSAVNLLECVDELDRRVRRERSTSV